VPTDVLALRAYEFWFFNYRRIWRGNLVSTVVNPVLYLAALGIGLGHLVNRTHHLPGHVSYLAFVAPGLLAATAMQVAASESTFPVLAAIKWVRNYHAMLATPLRVDDVFVGHQLWMWTRVLAASLVYFCVIAAFGALHSPLAGLAIVAAFFVGTAFAAPITAIAARMDNGAEFNVLFRFGIIPMFLFSGTFFPVSRLPELLRPIAYATPLWHGVALCRGFTLGTIQALPALGHFAYLLAWTAVGLYFARGSYRWRLWR
jgi:lipooligosaccharide transport system permease protein